MNIIPHLRYQIENCQIRSYPWYHVVFDKIFTTEQYALILDNLPPEQALIDSRIIHPVGKDYSPNRFVLDDPDKIPDEACREFWKNIYADFTNGEIKHAVLNRFHRLLEHQIGPDYLQTCGFYDTIELTLDKVGYELPLHTDAFIKIFTIVINLPRDRNNLNQGTAMYSFDNELIYQSEYAPNTGFGVFRSNDSWHGVETTTADRWTMQYTLWGHDR